MFQCNESKAIAATIQKGSSTLRQSINSVVESAIVGNNEVPFIRALVAALPSAVDGALHTLGVPSLTRAHTIHQKPMVQFREASSTTAVRCELGDVLYVVKYKHSAGIEAKSIIWQMKSCANQGGRECHINERQLHLLHRWPTCEFGRDAAGTPIQFTLAPKTLECGSYMVMLRRPSRGEIVSDWRRDYGVAASAWRISREQSSLQIDRVPYCLTATDGLLNQIAFTWGEPHTTPGMQELIDALYRFCGWAPDPPDEFDGYFEDYSQRQEEGVFAIIETTVSVGEPQRR